jgi:hypothetical protein
LPDGLFARPVLDHERGSHECGENERKRSEAAPALTPPGVVDHPEADVRKKTAGPEER